MGRAVRDQAEGWERWEVAHGQRAAASPPRPQPPALALVGIGDGALLGSGPRHASGDDGHRGIVIDGGRVVECHLDV